MAAVMADASREAPASRRERHECGDVIVLLCALRFDALAAVRAAGREVQMVLLWL